MNVLEFLGWSFAPVFWVARALRRAVAWLKFRLFVLLHRRRTRVASGVVEFHVPPGTVIPVGTLVQTWDGKKFETLTTIGGEIEFYGSGARVDVGDE